MDYFIHEYTIRSMLPHYGTPGVHSFLHNSKHFYDATPNATEELHYGSYSVNSENSQYFISQSTAHLLNDSDYVVDSSDFNNTTDPIRMLASMAITIATTATNLRTFKTVPTTDNYDNSILLSDNGIRSSINSTFENIFNISCDDEDSFSGGAGGNSAMMGNVTSEEEEDSSPLTSVYFKTAVYLLYIPIFIFALLGNGTVCYIVQSTPRMRTVTNYFIANLAVGDILMSLFCVPFSFVSIFIIRYWPFGIVLCYLVNYSQAVSVLVSAYTLVAISVDRYIAIMWPLRPRITKRYAKFIIAGVWSIALATALPIPIVSKLTPPDEWHEQCHRYICREEWPTNEQSYYYSLALFTLQFVVPLAVLIFTYTRIALAVWGKRPPGEAENSRDQRMARSKRKVSRCHCMFFCFTWNFYFIVKR